MKGKSLLRWFMCTNLKLHKHACCKSVCLQYRWHFIDIQTYLIFHDWYIDTEITKTRLNTYEMIVVLVHVGNLQNYKPLVFNFRFVWHLLDCADLLKFGRKIFAVWPPSASQRVICCYRNALTNDMREIYTALCDLRVDSRIHSANLFASPYTSSVRWRTSPFGQNFYYLLVGWEDM